MLAKVDLTAPFALEMYNAYGPCTVSFVFQDSSGWLEKQIKFSTAGVEFKHK